MVMKPPPRTKQDYERVPVYDEWINGVIEDIEHDPARVRVFKGEEKTGPAVRFKFQLDGCQFAHRTPWMSFSYHEKSRLFQKYLCGLVEGAQPDMDFDLEKLKGMKIKTMWSQNGDFDNLEMIRPSDKKLSSDIPF